MTVARPVIGLGLVILAWWLVTELLDIRPVHLPSPVSVLRELVDRPQYLLENAWVTLFQTSIGFCLTVIGGVALGAAVARSRILDETVSPWLVALNAVPKVALAPLLVVWLGFGHSARIAMVILMCFFPILLATTAGLRATPAELVELARSLGASTLMTLVKIRFPYALPQIFVGMKVALPLAVVGSVIGEFRGNDGLGQIIVRATALADTALAFAAIVVLSTMSVVLYYGVVYLERLLLPWVRSTT